MIHEQLAHSADEQCPFATPNGDDGYLHCALKAGHERLGFDHVDTYDALAGKTTSDAHTSWFRVSDEERQRLAGLPLSLNLSGGAA